MWFSKAVVECYACGHMIAKSQSYNVICRLKHYDRDHRTNLIYCRGCKPIYTTIEYGLRTRYFKELEVDHDGIPIGYIKV